MKQEQKRQLFAIIIFYAIAVVIRALAMKIEPTDTIGIRYFLRGWAGGIGPCIGAMVAVRLFKRKFFCSISGVSIVKSIISVAVPFCICFFFRRELSYILLGFMFYSFLEEVGWRGYLQGEFNNKSELLMALAVGVMWFLWHLRLQFSFNALFFLAILVFGSWGIGRIARDTQSLMACACFHTLYNFSIHGMFQFTPYVVCIYVIVVVSWFVIWYMPWEKLIQKIKAISINK